MINVTVHVPSEAFGNILRRYTEGSTRSFQDSVKSRLRDILIRAYKYTKVAAKELIAHRLGAIAQRVSISRKTGKVKGRNFQFSDKSLAYRIVQKRHVDVHGRGMSDKEADQKADKLIRAVLRTVGFIRSGWIPALRKLNAGLSSSEQRGRPKGYLTQRRTQDDILLEAGNTTKAAGPIGEQALARGMAEVQAMMEATIAKDMQPALKQIDGMVIR